MDNYKVPRVGVGVFVLKEGHILLGKRKSAHGGGTWGLPGGHLEWQESLVACAEREVREETGLSIGNVRHAAFTNDLFVLNSKHYVTLFVLADYMGGEPLVCEPEKCEVWQWYTWDALPTPLFLPLHNLVTSGFELPFFRNSVLYQSH